MHPGIGRAIARCLVSGVALLASLFADLQHELAVGANFNRASSATGLNPNKRQCWRQLFPPIHTKPLWSMWDAVLGAPRPS